MTTAELQEQLDVLSEQQKQEAQYIWETNIDGETYIDNPNEVSDKLVLIDSGTGL